MKHTLKITILAISFGLMLTMPAWAFDGRNAYEAGDGHWIYFGPAASGDWTTQRIMPRKRSLEQSIRRDALRHYEMPRYELPESGQAIAFGPQDETATVRARAATRRPPASPWEVYELPESGQTIVFPKAKSPATVGENVVARKNATLP